MRLHVHAPQVAGAMHVEQWRIPWSKAKTSCVLLEHVLTPCISIRAGHPYDSYATPSTAPTGTIATLASSPLKRLRHRRPDQDPPSLFTFCISFFLSCFPVVRLHGNSLCSYRVGLALPLMRRQAHAPRATAYTAWVPSTAQQHVLMPARMVPPAIKPGRAGESDLRAGSGNMHCAV